LWLGKVRGFVVSVKADIDKELAAEELKRTLTRQASMPELDEIIEETTGKTQSAVRQNDAPPLESGTTLDRPPTSVTAKETDDKDT
jgi:sec-independent protein translocase protein TatB